MEVYVPAGEFMLIKLYRPGRYEHTGLGGTFIGWMSSEGKFFYQKSGYPIAMEAHLGRQLGAFDGYNGILRQIRTQVKADADKTFLKECLTPAERRHLVNKDEFHFGIVSARRATGDRLFIQIG